MFGLDSLPSLAPQAGHLSHNIAVLFIAALLGAALGIVRPVRREIIPRSARGAAQILSPSSAR
jgi:hypothetical protein